MSYKVKINLAVLFRHKNPENVYTIHKKYGVYVGLSGPLDLVFAVLVFGSQNALAFGSCLLTYDSYCKLHTRSKKAHFAP